MQLFKKLVLMFLAIGCLPLGVAGTLLVRGHRSSLKASVLEREQEQALSLARTAGLELGHVTAALEAHFVEAGVSEMSPRDRDSFAQLVLDKHRTDLTVVSLWGEGRSQPLSLAYYGEDRSIAEGHLQAISTTVPEPGHTVIGDVYLSASGDPAVTLLLPFRRGVSLAAEVRLDHLQEDLARTWVEAGGDAMLLDAHGRVVAAKEITLAKTRADLSDERFLAGLLGASGSGHSQYTDSSGERWLAAWAPAHGVGWTAVVQEPEAAVLEPATRMAWNTAAIALLTMLCATLAGVGFARRMATPIRKVVTGSLSIARGRFGSRVPVERRDEIGELAHTFNYMSQQLSDYDKENKRLYLDLERGYVETIRALANSIDAKDPYTRGHSQRVTEYSVEIARELGLPEEEVARIQFGGILHDIGKIGIKERVLGKNAPLTDEEYEYMKTHPLLGVGIVDPIEFLHRVKPIIRSHHERWDGKGYPDGLSGQDIDIGARIVNVADSWDAMVTQRPYNTPMTWDQAIARLKEIAGQQHDAKVTEAFLAVLSRRRAEEQAGDAWRKEQTSARVVELPKR